MPVEKMGFRQEGAQKNRLALIVMPDRGSDRIQLLSGQIPPGSKSVDKPFGIGEFESSDTAGMLDALNGKLRQDADFFPSTVIIFVKGLPDQVRQRILHGRDVRGDVVVSYQSPEEKARDDAAFAPKDDAERLAREQRIRDWLGRGRSDD